MIAIDTETELIAPGQQAPRLVCVSVSDGSWRGQVYHHTERLSIEPYLRMHEKLAGHNIAYDMSVLAVQWPDLLPTIFDAYEQDCIEDTGIRAQLLDLAAGSLGWGSINGKRTRFQYSLAELCKRYFGVVLEKDNTYRLRYGQLRDLSLDQWPAEAIQYAQDDAHATATVWLEQERSDPSLFKDQHRQARAAFWIQLMSCWGMTVDHEAVQAFADGARRRYQDLAAELVRHGLKRPDRTLKSGPRKGEIVEGARDTKAAMTRVVAAYRGRELPLTDGGKPATDDDTCIQSGDPLLVSYGRFGKASKVLSNDVPIFHKYGHPIHARFATLLETGDIGCLAPNLVNLPTRPGVRECFAPRDGFVFLACDYAAVQLRTWAQVCLWTLGYSKMADVLNAGDDPHCTVAAEILGTTYADAFAHKTEIFFERQCGKVANFGFPGGMGAERLVEAAATQYQVTITLEQARQLKTHWLRWPEAGPYLAMVSRMTASGKRIQIKQFLSERLRGGLGYCDTANGLFSALAYDAIKAAGWLVCKACYLPGSVLYGSRIVNVIHDELLLEVPEELGHECAEETGRLMREGAQPWMPDVRVTTEETLMRHWSKQAKARRDETGRLLVWS